MREQLKSYVDLLFAGADNASEIKQEILQNTLDRYDDLIAQGKSPQGAYQLAISGIGDISEILGSNGIDTEANFNRTQNSTSEKYSAPTWKKLLRAIAISLYIISIIPLIVLSETGFEIIGLCAMLAIIAVATALIIIASGKSNNKQEMPAASPEPKSELHKAIDTIINTVGLVVYFVLSFSTNAWYITWLVFPIMAAVHGLVNACIDLKEANDHEK